MKCALALLLCCLVTAQVRSAGPMTHYRIEQDIYVRDGVALCRQAWDKALNRFGPGVAETVTMTAGQFDPAKCLQVVVQTADLGEQVVSAGLHVMEAP